MCSTKLTPPLENNFPLRKLDLCEFACSAPFKHFMKVQMCNRCPPSRFPISLHACSGSWGGGHYCILAERLDGSQFSGGASNEEEGRPGGDGCFFHLHYLRLWWLLAHLQTLCVFNQWTTQNRKHKGHAQRTRHTRLLQPSSESIRNPHGAQWAC